MSHRGESDTEFKCGNERYRDGILGPQLEDWTFSAYLTRSSGGLTPSRNEDTIPALETSF